MNQATKINAGAAGRMRGLVLGAALFAAGAALSAWWFLRAPSPDTAPANSGPPALSDASRTVLQNLHSPIEIRFYSLLDPASVGDSGREFAARVDQLLSRYEQEGAGKIKIERVNSISTATANAALADGISAFNMDKGDACYLGIAVFCNGQKYSLASLDPAWETALEPDISRVIAAADYSAPRPAAAARTDVASVEAVKRAIPNQDAVSVESGSRQLRIAALAEFEKTAQEMEAKVTAAEERLQQAQNSQNATDQEEAFKDLQKAEREQTDKLRDIALESKAQLAAWQQLKGAAR